MGWIAGSFLADLYYERKPKGRGWLAVVSTIASIIGIVDVVKSFITRRDAKAVEREREQMGPQPVVLPSDAPAVEPDKDCAPCKFTGKTAQRSLAEYAEKTPDNGVREL